MAFDDTKMDAFFGAGIAVILIAVSFGMDRLGWATTAWVGFGFGAGLFGYAWWLGRPWRRR